MARIRLVFSIGKCIGEHWKGNSFGVGLLKSRLVLEFYTFDFIVLFFGIMSEEGVPTFRKPKKKQIQTRTKVDAEDAEEDIS